MTREPDHLPESPLSSEMERIVRRALAEDLGAGDVTSAALLPDGGDARGVIRARQSGVLSGIAVAREVFRVIDPALRFDGLREDGDLLEPECPVVMLKGAARSILAGERVALNFLQHLSGIATLTARFVTCVRATGVCILDTRKTTPGLRVLEKAAVRHGGGRNHRRGLDDAILVKDNHVAAVGSFTEAVRRALVVRESTVPATPRRAVIVEARTLEEACLAAGAGVDRVMLDNFTPADVARAVATVRRLERPAGPRIEIEVSGGISLDNVREYALAGVDFISIGALTHSAPALDLSLDLEPDR